MGGEIHRHRDRRRGRRKGFVGTAVGFLGSRKLTPFAAAIAMASLLGYKFCLDREAESGKKPSASKLAVSLLDPKETIGRARSGGPLLTRSFFKHGDLLVRGVRRSSASFAMVDLSGRRPRAMVGGGRKLPLLDWLRGGDGRFAVIRARHLTAAERSRAVERIAGGWKGNPDGLERMLGKWMGPGVLALAFGDANSNRRAMIAYDDRAQRSDRD